MHRCNSFSRFIATVAVGALLAAAAPAFAQGAPKMGSARAAAPAPIGPAPEQARPFVGAWNVRSDRGAPPVRSKANFNPEYRAKYEEVMRVFLSGAFQPSRTEKCVPSGWPSMIGLATHIEANAEYITQFGGEGPAVRMIWLNRKAHTPKAKLKPTFGGEGIGHWEGDTLVVDIVGIDPTNEIIRAMTFDDPDLHVTERYRMVTPNQLEVKATVDSPKTLLEPWTFTSTLTRLPMNTDLTFCTNPIDSESGALDLSPPLGGYIPPGADK